MFFISSASLLSIANSKHLSSTNFLLTLVTLDDAFTNSHSFAFSGSRNCVEAGSEESDADGDQTRVERGEERRGIGIL